MGVNTEKLTRDSFAQFNRTREILAQQFYEIIGIVGNQVFQGKIDTNSINLLEEINRQTGLMDMEKNILRQLIFYANTLLHSKFLLGVLGRFKSGKSTILNALAGSDISPMDTRISTGILNFTYYSEREECLVIYDNGQELPITPEEKILYIDFRYNPDNEKGIHSVRHGAPNLALQREIIFVDTPGLEAVNQIHEKITLDFVSQCHAAIIVSTYPPFGLTELQFYERIKGKIPNIFLIQNLPADKIMDWVKLEAQTLENLHKLGFYILSAEVYGNQDVRSILRKIAEKQDEVALAEFKKVHHIHLYSIDAKTAYQILVSDEIIESTTKSELLGRSRFNVFKTDLYEFLTQHKGKILLDDYVQKAIVMLRELIQMIQKRQEFLRKGLKEIEQQIAEQSNKKQQASIMVNMLMDRSTLQIMDSYRKLKSVVMDQDLVATLQELNQSYGQLNIFRMRGVEIKNIKLKVADFNRLVGQRFQNFLQQLQQEIQSAQEQIAKAIENHGAFSHIEFQAMTFDSLSLGEISGAGYINTGFEVVFRGGLAYIFGSLAGGTGIALLSPFLGPTFAILVGAAFGLGISIPLSKYCSPALEYCKNLLSKIAHRPAQAIFDKFRSDVRERLDEIERTILDPAVQKFKTQALDNTNKYFELFTQRLQELHNRKTSGMTQQMCEQECQKLQLVVDQLQNISGQLDKKEEATEIAGKLKNWVKGVQSYLKKFGK